MTWLPLALRLARRELRGGLAAFGIFLACLALGVGAIAAIGSLAAAVQAGLAGDGRALLGGDAEFRLANRPASPAERAALAGAGTISQVAQLRAMARTEDGRRRSLVDVKAVDGAYPLYGRVDLQPAQPLAAALGLRQGSWGAAVDPALLARLGLAPGDRLRIGTSLFTIRATLAGEPDIAGDMLVLGPRVLVSLGGLAASGLTQPGALLAYSYRLRLVPGTPLDAVLAGLAARFPDAGWRVRDERNAAPAVATFVTRLTLFLGLIGLATLLVGAIGIGNAVSAYLTGKVATIATLKCLGAPSGLIFRLYLAQVLTLACAGILAGLALGAAAPVVVVRLLAADLPVPAHLGLYPAPLAFAAACGLLVTLAASLWPLGRARDVPAGQLFRAAVAPAARPAAAALAGSVAAGLALALLAIIAAPDRWFALWFVCGTAAVLAAFRLAALAITAAARRVRGVRRPVLRLALANLHRPGAPTGSIVTALGVGLTMLLAVVLVEGDLLRELREALPAAAPTYFFLDIQPDEAAEFGRLMTTTPGLSGYRLVPMLRGRILRLAGVPVAAAKVAAAARGALAGDRGLTYAAAPPPGSHVVAGAWWPADYRGPPLISLDAGLAQGMGLAVGDTLTVDVLGRAVTARIANLRSIDWASLGINFAIVFAPGTLEAAPQTGLATVRAAPAAEDALERQVAERFPNVTAIRVKDALDAVTRLLQAIAASLRAAAALTLTAGVLVLAGAVAAGQRRRVYDAVVLKVLGATRGDLARIFIVEYGLVGLLAAGLAGLAGSLAAFLVLTRIIRADWAFLPGPVLGIAVLAIAVTLVVGFAGTWRALAASPARRLRDE